MEDEASAIFCSFDFTKMFPVFVVFIAGLWAIIKAAIRELQALLLYCIAISLGKTKISL